VCAGARWSHAAVEKAVQGGHLQVLEYMHNKRWLKILSRLPRNFSSRHECREPRTHDVGLVEAATAAGHVHILQYLLKKGYSCSHEARALPVLGFYSTRLARRVCRQQIWLLDWVAWTASSSCMRRVGCIAVILR
jgi:hypothetical protein